MRIEVFEKVVGREKRLKERWNFEDREIYIKSRKYCGKRCDSVFVGGPHPSQKGRVIHSHSTISFYRKRTTRLE